MNQSWETPLESGAKGLWETRAKALLTKQMQTFLSCAVSCVRQNYVPTYANGQGYSGYTNTIETESTLGQDDITSGLIGAFQNALPGQSFDVDPYGAGKLNPIRSVLGLEVSFSPGLIYMEINTDTTNYTVSFVAGNFAFYAYVIQPFATISAPVFQPVSLGVAGSPYFYGPAVLGGPDYWLNFQIPTCLSTGSYNINGWSPTGVVAYPRTDPNYIVDYLAQPNGGVSPTTTLQPGYDGIENFNIINLPSPPFGPNYQSFQWRKLPLSGTSVVLNPRSAGGSISLHTINMDGTLNPADPANVHAVAGTNVQQTFNGPLDMAQIFWFFRPPEFVPTTANSKMPFDPHNIDGHGETLIVLK